MKSSVFWRLLGWGFLGFGNVALSLLPSLTSSNARFRRADSRGRRPDSGGIEDSRSVDAWTTRTIELRLSLALSEKTSATL